MTGHRRYGISAWPSETSAKPPELSSLFGRVLMPDALERVLGRVLEPAAAAEVAWHGSDMLPSLAQSR